jgi:hypothetical protein
LSVSFASTKTLLPASIESSDENEFGVELPEDDAEIEVGRVVVVETDCSQFEGKSRIYDLTVDRAGSGK